ncbi:phosphoribosyltransferase [Candidatus Micrarchaeota archaeon]|nr:phosphoribosyltransferase [Candidatus Micrarchaeota archaeon]
MDLLRISWNAVIEYCEDLAEKSKEFKPDIIIGISRGGLVPARILSDILAVKKIGIVGVAFYKSAGETSEHPEIIQELSMDVKGKRILLVDDVADTGKSLVAAKKYLEEKEAGEIRTATIHFKPQSTFKPDYYVGTTTAWIVYPWERHEVERDLS